MEAWTNTLPLLYALAAWGGAYAAVRVEIRHIWRKIGEMDKSISRAHERLDRSNHY